MTAFTNMQMTMQEEDNLGLDDMLIYNEFADKVNKIKEKLPEKNQIIDELTKFCLHRVYCLPVDNKEETIKRLDLSLIHI